MSQRSTNKLSRLLGFAKQVNDSGRVKKRNRRLILESLERREVFAAFASGDLSLFMADTVGTNSSISIVEVNPTLINQTTPVQTIAVNGTTGTDALRIDQSSTSNGYLSNSSDGTLLVLSGHNTTSTSTLSALKGVGVLNKSGVYSMPTTYTGVATNQPQGATSVNNTSFAITDQGGVFTNGSAAASPATTALKATKAFASTIYVGRNNAGTPAVATLSALSGGTVSSLPGLPNLASANFSDFYLVQSGSSGLTYDVLYVLQTSSILKFSLVGTTWTANGSIATGGYALAARDLDFTNTYVGADLYLTTGDGATAANTVINIRDFAGYNQTISVAGSPQLLYTAPTGKTLKGVAFAPALDISFAPVIASNPVDTTVTYGTNATFSGSVSALPRASVQWQTFVGSTWTNISSLTDNGIYTGFTTNTLTLNKPPVALSGRTYRAFYFNSQGAAITSTAILTVNRKALIATGTAANKVYDSTTAATTSVSLSGVVAGETVTATVTGTFVNKNVGNGKTVNLVNYVLAGPTAVNYTVTGNATTTANITKFDLTSTRTAANKVYDGNTTALVTIVLTNVFAGDVVSATAASTFDNKNVGVGKTVTTNSITLTGTDAGNYSIPLTPTLTADITPRAMAITATGVNKIYDGLLNATVVFSDDRVSGDVLTITGTSTFADKNVGNAKPVTVTGITVTGTDAGNYTYNTSTSTTANITARALLVTAQGIDKVYDSLVTAAVTVADNRVSGDVLTIDGYSAAFDNKNVGTNKTVTVTGINVTGTDVGNYTFNTTTTTTANITKFELTSSATADNKVYNATTTANVNVSLVGVFAGDVVTATAPGNFSDKNVGTAKTVTVGTVVLGGTDGGNYSVVAPASPVADITPFGLTSTAVASNKVYDANTVASVAISLVGVFSGDVVAGAATGSFADKNVGTGKTVTVGTVSLSGLDAGNYTVTGPASPTADITKFGLTSTATAINKVYDGNVNATVNIVLVGVIGSDDVSGSATGTFADKNIGAGKIVTVGTVALSGTDAGNYSVSQPVSPTANITPFGVSSTATASNKVYDGNTTASVSIVLVGVLGSDDVTGAATGAFDDKNVGTGKTVTVGTVVLSGADAANYSVTQPVAPTADITKFGLTSTATSPNRVYDATTNAAVSIALVGVIGSDVVSGSATGAFADKNVGTGKTVTVGTVALSGADAGNYSVAQPVAPTADITKFGLTSTATSPNRVYDATANAAVSIALVGVIGIDDVSGSATGAFADKNVGNAKVVTVGTVALAGADAGNYSVAAPASPSADVTQFALVGTVTAANKPYDGTTAATILTRSIATVFGGDTVSYIGGTANFADAAVGAGKVVTATGLSLSGADAGNYSVNSTAGTTADILNVVPVLTVDNAAVSGNEGTTITNTGTWADPGDTVTLSASVGSVVKNGDGTWSWSLVSTDNVASTMVTITANDGNGGSTSVSFTYTVNNVGPTLTRNLATVSGNVLSVLTNSGTYADVPADTVSLSVDAGAIVNNGNGTWSWSMTPTAIITNQVVTVTATDEDGGSATVTFTVNAVAVIATRGTFYNNATGASASSSLATDKVPLLPGQSSTFANYTNYSRGLNGVVVDIAGLPATTTVPQFLASLQLSQWNGIAAGGFAALPGAAIPSVTLQPGLGAGGATRVRITFPDNTLQNTWLKVEVVANANTGITANDVFYFGNVIGEFNTGNTATRYRVNSQDTSAVRNNQATGTNAAGVTNIYDVNRDGRVNSQDTSIVRNNQQTSGIVAPITVPASGPGPLNIRGGNGSKGSAPSAPLKDSAGSNSGTGEKLIIAPPQNLSGPITITASQASVPSDSKLLATDLPLTGETRGENSSDYLESLDSFYSSLWRGL
jgi:hypothetical protein